MRDIINLMDKKKIKNKIRLIYQNDNAIKNEINIILCDEIEKDIRKKLEEKI
jgi:hypothetical protein